MKKIVLSAMLLFISFSCFPQNAEVETNPAAGAVAEEPVAAGSIRRIFDIDFRFYTPSLFGIVTGDNPRFGLRKSIDEVKKCSNFMIESRSSIFETETLTLSWSFASGGYIEYNGDNNTNLDSFNVSLGLGLYLHLFSAPAPALNGLCLYLYPVYQIPVFTRDGYTPYLSWKTAFDIGYNFLILGGITVYPYVRNVVGWNSQDIRYGIDFGLAIGMYFPDNGK